MAQSPTPPTIGRIVHYHHPSEGVVSGEVQDFPAMILEVSGGPISPPTSSPSSLEGDDDADADTGLQTSAVQSEPYVCMLEIFRPRGTEWRRCSEGEEPGQWSWPERSVSLTIDTVEDMVKGFVEREVEKTFELIEIDSWLRERVGEIVKGITAQ